MKQTAFLILFASFSAHAMQTDETFFDRFERAYQSEQAAPNGIRCGCFEIDPVCIDTTKSKAIPTSKDMTREMLSSSQEIEQKSRTIIKAGLRRVQSLHSATCLLELLVNRCASCDIE